MLDAQGYFVNEYGINNVLLHVAIAVDRASKRAAPRSRAPPPSATAGRRIPAGARRPDHHATSTCSSTPTDLDYLAMLLTTRVITPGPDRAASRTVVDDYVERRRPRERAPASSPGSAEEYLVDLDDEDFIVRLDAARAATSSRARTTSRTRATR